MSGMSCAEAECRIAGLMGMPGCAKEESKFKISSLLFLCLVVCG
jgi:hypothetical protein